MLFYRLKMFIIMHRYKIAGAIYLPAIMHAIYRLLTIHERFLGQHKDPGAHECHPMNLKFFAQLLIRPHRLPNHSTFQLQCQQRLRISFTIQ